MKKAKEKISKAKFEEAVARYTNALQREAEINRVMEDEINEILAKHEESLHSIADEKKKAFDIAHAYCTANKQQLFTKRRSIGLPQGIAGFRLGTPRLCITSGSGWQDVVGRLKELLPDYVRTTDEPARDMLLADRHKPDVAPLLVQLGLQVVQDDLFYIQPHRAAA